MGERMFDIPPVPVAGDEMLAIPIWEPRTPAFASIPALAAGMPRDVDRFVALRREALEGPAGGDPDGDALVEAWRRWRGGERDIKVSVAYGDLPFARPFEVIGTRHVDLEGDSFDWRSVWGRRYRIEAEGISCDVAWGAWDGGMALRATRSSVRRLLVDGRDVAACWGEPGILDIGGAGAVSTTLWLVDRAYPAPGEALAEMCGEVDLRLSHVIGHVVADG